MEQTSGVGLARSGSTPFSTDENADYQNRSAAPLPRLRRLGIDGMYAARGVLAGVASVAPRRGHCGDASNGQSGMRTW